MSSEDPNPETSPSSTCSPPAKLQGVEDMSIINTPQSVRPSSRSALKIKVNNLNPTLTSDLGLYKKFGRYGRILGLNIIKPIINYHSGNKIHSSGGTISNKPRTRIAHLFKFQSLKKANASPALSRHDLGLVSVFGSFFPV